VAKLEVLLPVKGLAEQEVDMVPVPAAALLQARHRLAAQALLGLSSLQNTAHNREALCI